MVVAPAGLVVDIAGIVGATGTVGGNVVVADVGSAVAVVAVGVGSVDEGAVANGEVVAVVAAAGQGAAADSRTASFGVCVLAKQ